MRGARDAAVIPLRTDTLTSDTLERAVAGQHGRRAAASRRASRPSGSGPFQVRPRLRGLDSTRVLVLVDGERLNNARTATDRAGVEVGLVGRRLDRDDRGARRRRLGALRHRRARRARSTSSPTAPQLSSTRQFIAGFDGFYSSNENGRRGTVTLGVSDRRWAVSLHRRRRALRRLPRRQGLRRDARRRSSPTARSTRPTRSTTNFGFNFNAFPESVQRAVHAHVATSSRVRAMKRLVGQPRPRSRWCVAIADARGPLPAAPRGRRRLPGLRAAVLLPVDHAAVEQSRQGLGDLRVHGPDAVASSAVGRRRTSSGRIACCATTSRCSSRRRRRDVLPDQRVPADIHERHAPAGVDARRRSCRPTFQLRPATSSPPA